MALHAFKLSSLPFFPAIVFRLSSALTLWIGLLCANSVNAERRSDRVPEARTLEMNCSSDLDVEGGGGRDAWRDCAFVRREASTDDEGSERGSSVGARVASGWAYHCDPAVIF